MRISSKRQIAIPKHVMAAMSLNVGDEIDIRVENGTAYMVPVAMIKVPRDQAWFWTKEWQEKEREADADITEGKIRDFDSIEALMKDLHSDH
jgi:bifunctional DNA-binding transcriptional regulator/antitoxin component of YhaV-PrlF toxin-antitoxin module